MSSKYENIKKTGNIIFDFTDPLSIFSPVYALTQLTEYELLKVRFSLDKYFNFIFTNPLLTLY
jgi:hypothetical protein